MYMFCYFALHFSAGLWEMTYDRTTGTSRWIQANTSGGLYTSPPAVTQALGALDAVRGKLYVWHGLHETFGPAATAASNTMWIYSWYGWLVVHLFHVFTKVLLFS